MGKWATWLACVTLMACSDTSSSSPGDTSDLATEPSNPKDALDEDASSTDTPPATPSDDPLDYDVDTSVEYEPVLSNFRWVVPSDVLPPEAASFTSNNNLDIQFHDGRLFLAYRTSRDHFASAEVYMYLVSSGDQGESWDFERMIHIGADMREPRFLSLNGQLQLMFFQAGTNPFAFEPQRVWRTKRLEQAHWTEIEMVDDSPLVPWTVKVRGGLAYMTSYRGNHYAMEEMPNIEVYFDVTQDGDTWSRVGGAPFVYHGGVSEAAFEFDEDGSLWAVTRNEDGDQTGFGSHVCYAHADSLGDWECSSPCDPERYDSPALFRHGKDIYLAARKDIGGPFDQGLDDLPYSEQKSKYLMDYSLRPKAFALYRVDKDLRKVVHLMDLPGVGDTAFAAIRRTGPHTFLLANYTSPLHMTDAAWLEAQISPEGTQIYFVDIEFRPVGQ